MSGSLGLNLFSPQCKDCKHFIPPTPPLHRAYGKCSRFQYANVHASDKKEYLYAIIARDFDCVDARHFEKGAVV